MKERDTANDASGWDGAPAAKLTPVDVQQKEFRVARFGAGYRMREVDEFLDHVTDALTALIAENERLQRAAGTTPPAQPAVAPPAGDGDRAAVDAFLRSEKGFLQDLGTLVQSHAEELKTMVRSARRQPTAAAAATEQAQPSDTADDADDADVDVTSRPVPESETPVEETPPVGDAASAVADDVGDTAPGSAAPEGSTEDEDDAVTDDDDATGVVVEEPIRLDEREPARSGRTDDDRDPSLRELFWGEE